MTVTSSDINTQYRKTGNKNELRKNRGLLASQELLQSLDNNEGQMKDILNIVQDSSIITQILGFCPDFFNDQYIIATIIKNESINEFMDKTVLPINPSDSDYSLSILETNVNDLDIHHINYRQGGALTDQLFSEYNILLIPSEGLHGTVGEHQLSSDTNYPLAIVNKDKGKLKVKYSTSTNTGYQVTSRHGRNLGVGSKVSEEDIYTALHATSSKNQRPCIALSRKAIDGYYTMSDKFEVVKID